MITKRIIPCLDVKNGRVVKGVNFEGLQDMADPVEMARYYNASGADELVFYDITASVEGRGLFTDILRRVASQIFIPLTVGGGINTPDDFDRAPLARKEELIESDPAWGQIICRCETVPEAEIVAAIRRRPGAVSVEGVKRSCRAGMGRCQSGFCQSRVVAILTRELGCDPSEVLLEDAGSWLVEGPLKGVR